MTTLEKPICVNCRRPFTPTRKRYKVCPRKSCRLEHAYRSFNAPLYKFNRGVKVKL